MNQIRVPILLFGFITLLLRIVALFIYYYSDSSTRDPFGSLMSAIGYHLVFVVTIISILYLITGLFRRQSKFMEWLALVTYILMMAFHITDLTLQRLAGVKLSPEVIQSFGVRYITHPDMINALVSDWKFTLVVTGLLFISAISCSYYWKYFRSIFAYPHIAKAAIIIFFGISILFYIDSTETIYYHEIKPPELNFIVGEKKTNPIDEKSLESALNLLRKIRGVEELDQDYPFYGKLPQSTNDSIPATDLPDIFIIIIESLRGGDLKFAGSPNPAYTPNIDSLANLSHVFPKMIANGQPTQEGFFVINTSIIPHRYKKIGAEFKANHFTALPTILKEGFGYETTVYWASTPGERNTKYWSKQWYENVLYPNHDSDTWHENYSDLVFYKKVIEEITRKDSDVDDRPLFMYIQNDDTHYPFRPDFNYFENPAQHDIVRRYVNERDDLAERYKRTLSWTDYNLGRLLRFLGRRDKAGNTIIILTGDHAKDTGEKMDQGVKFAPNNAILHTGALIFGPIELVGKPDKPREFPSSLVDIMPTVLDILNYQKPLIHLGRSLFGEEGERYALAVSSGVFRLDYKNQSLYVNGRNVDDVWLNDFEDLSYTKEATDSKQNQKLAQQVYDLMHFWSYQLDNDHLYNWKSEEHRTVNP